MLVCLNNDYLIHYQVSFDLNTAMIPVLSYRRKATISSTRINAVGSAKNVFYEIESLCTAFRLPGFKKRDGYRE